MQAAAAARPTWRRFLAFAVLQLGLVTSLLLFSLAACACLDALVLLPHFGGWPPPVHRGKSSCEVRHGFHGRIARHAASLDLLMRKLADGSAGEEGVDMEDHADLLAELSNSQDDSSSACRLAKWASGKWSLARHEARTSGSAYVHATAAARDAWHYKSIDGLSLDQLLAKMREKVGASASEDEICRAVSASLLMTNVDSDKSVEAVCKDGHGYVRETLQHYFNVGAMLVAFRVMLSVREYVNRDTLAAPASDTKKSTPASDKKKSKKMN